jgi:5-hydroxyisourate hydrolase-like protein (transthyretin family)
MKATAQRFLLVTAGDGIDTSSPYTSCSVFRQGAYSFEYSVRKYLDHSIVMMISEAYVDGIIAATDQ